MRLTIAASAAATVLYTPVIKRHLLAKNLVVASTIAAAPLAGALAAGAAGPGLRAVLVPTAFLWLGILQREIMMDIQVCGGQKGTDPMGRLWWNGLARCLLAHGQQRQGRPTLLPRQWCRVARCRLACSTRHPPPLQDRLGDGAAGVRTLPVVLGPRAALGVCLSLLISCFALAAHAVLAGGGLAWAWAGHPGLEAPLRATALAAVAAVLAAPVSAALAVLRSDFSRDRVSAAISVSMKSVGLGTLLLAILA